jgi:futalosine hydrolase
MVATAVWTSRTLMQGPYDFALNVGVCGAFDRALHPGTVVHVASDCLVELGAEDDERFLTIHDLQLLAPDEFPFRGGLLHTAPRNNIALARLPAVSAVTVSTVHGREASIAALQARAAPQVESMEGAAFMYACTVASVPFAQVRAVSNIVEKRHRAAWKLPEAVRALGAATLDILDHA